MARQLLTVGRIGSNGILFKAGTPVEGAMGQFIQLDAAEFLDDEDALLYADGQAYMNDGDKRTCIAVWNNSAVPTTLTIETYQTMEGLPVADRTVTVAAGDIVMVRPGPASVYNQPNGQIYFSLAPYADIWVAVVKVDA
ncbi:MAG: hypothetical protein ACOYBO_01110 [Azonexus sp.]